jgi:hypothetical protein
VGKLLAEAEESGGSFASFEMQCTRAPGMLLARIDTVVARALRSWSLILVLSLIRPKGGYGAATSGGGLRVVLELLGGIVFGRMAGMVMIV